MKRTSDEAQRLSRTLVKEGYTRTSTRRLERWTQTGLGPAEDADFKAKLDHFRALAQISRSGVDADVTARRLAARGIVCARLRPAILSDLGLAPLDEGEVVVGFEPDPDTDTGFAAVEQIAWSMNDLNGLPPLFVRIIKALKRNAGRRAGETGRGADEVFHSFLVNGLCHLMGSNVYDPYAFAAVFNVAATEVPLDAVDEFNARIRPNMHDIDAAYRSMPLERIARIAQRLTNWVPLLLDYLGIKRAPDAEVEDIATMAAPFLGYFFDLLRAAYADFPDDELDWGAPELAAAST